MKTIRLYGDLGERFGRVWRLDVKSPAEAMRALQTVVPGLRAYFRQHCQSRYRIVAGGEDRDERTWGLNTSANTIRVVPLVCGSGPGVRFVLGAIITAVGVFTGWGSSFMVSVGTSMMAGGAIEMLSRPPSTSNQSVERPDNKPSYAFDGATNTAAQGNPVPVCYGEMIVGSQVISAGLTTEQVAA